MVGEERLGCAKGLVVLSASWYCTLAEFEGDAVGCERRATLAQCAIVQTEGDQAPLATSRPPAGAVSFAIAEGVSRLM